MKLFIEQASLISSFERKAFQNTKAKLALAAMAVVPALYCLIFLSSIKDPYGNLDRLPAAIVSLDQGTTVSGKTRIIGAELAAKLLKERRFGFIQYESEESARKAVREGKVFFSITIPQDFSRAAVQGKADARAKLKFYVSQGGNYFAFRVAESAINRIVASVNESLALTRWERVGAALPEVKEGFAKIKDASSKLAAGSNSLKAGASKVASGARELTGGIEKAETGAKSLADGSGKLSSAVDRLTAGMIELSDGIRRLNAGIPDSKDLAPLSQGVESLAANAALLADGLEQLSAGAAKAAEGATQGKDGSKLLADSVKESLFSPASLKTGTAKLAVGIEQLDQGVKTLAIKLDVASKGGAALADGASRLNSSVGTLLAGVTKIKSALNTMTAALAAPEDLNKLADGARQLANYCGELSAGLTKLRTGSIELARGADAVAAGASQLSDGANELSNRIPGSIDIETGDPAGMAASVAVEEETTAAVADNATAFTPYFLAISLWLGCIVMTFVFPFRSIPESLRSSSQTARVAAKLIRPGILAGAQVVAVILCLAAMGVRFDHPLCLIVTSLLSSWTFLLIVFMFLALLGDAGRLLCIILLVLQIGAAGGSFPVEVSPVFFRAVHSWLPMTYAVAGFRSSISSAFEGHLGMYLSAIAAFGVTALIILQFCRTKWRYVRDEEYRMVADY